MISALFSVLFSILIAAVVLYVVYLVASRSMAGQPLKTVGVVLRVVFGLVCVFLVLRNFNFISI